MPHEQKSGGRMRMRDGNGEKEFGRNRINSLNFLSAPGGIRTPNPRIRSPMLYPAELQAHKGNAEKYTAARQNWKGFSAHSTEEDNGADPNQLKQKGSLLPTKGIWLTLQPLQPGKQGSLPGTPPLLLTCNRSCRGLHVGRSRYSPLMNRWSVLLGIMKPVDNHYR